MAESAPHTELAETVLDESDYTAMWQADRSPDAPGRLENLKELVNAMGEFENLAGFLEHISLVMENSEADGRDLVNLMTLHSAKGLEFDTVFLPGWEHGLFPHQRALEESGVAGLEEERRLAYVGLTRAKRKAWVLFAANRRVHGLWQTAVPSRFVDELPREHVETASEQGVYGSTPRAGHWGPLWTETGPLTRAPRHRTERRGHGLLLEGNATRLAEAVDRPGFAAGARVFHQKFGYGTVRSAEGDKLEITFDKAGEKKVMASFVLPADGVA
jgi:DNA helicase-2/ATP-dependent DNA helicase PcrA